jgi:hypothetical protein
MRENYLLISVLEGTANVLHLPLNQFDRVQSSPSYKENYTPVNSHTHTYEILQSSRNGTSPFRGLQLLNVTYGIFILSHYP